MNIDLSTIVKGDLFVTRGQLGPYDERAFRVVSLKHATVSLSDKRKAGCNRGYTKLNVRMDPITQTFWVKHSKRSYSHVKQTDADFAVHDFEDEAEPVVPDFDARDHVSVGDRFKSNRWGTQCGLDFTGPVVKVTKCFVTLSLDGRGMEMQRVGVKLNDRWGPCLYAQHGLWTLWQNQ